MKKKFLLVLFVALGSVAYAQPGDPGDNPDASTPIDGGVSALAAAGVGYAIKKMRNARAKSKAESEIK